MKGKTKEDIVEYFEKKVIPLIEDRYPEVASEMNIRIDDLFFGSPEQCSNPDATIFLEDRLWAAKGGHVQLLLERSLDMPKEVQGVPGTRHCVGIWVHPLSWLRELRRFLDTRSGAKIPLPWEEVDVERFHEVQHSFMLRDPHGIFQHLKEATTPDSYPCWLWDKHLITGLNDLVDELRFMRTTLVEGRPLEANLILGGSIAEVLRLGFIIHRQYYPGHPYLHSAFKKLPSPADDALSHIESAISSHEPGEKVASLEAVRDIYIDYVVKNDLLPTVNLVSPDMGLGDLDEWENLHQELLWAHRCEAWSNPNWRDWVTSCQKMAAENGDANCWWIYSLWDLKRGVTHI